MNGEILLEILNYSNAYVVVLDRKMHIRFINIPLSKKLGFETNEEPLNRYWLDFIPAELHETIKIVHTSLINRNNHTKYREFSNKIMDIKGNEFEVKWHNTSINHDTFWTFSFGIPQTKTEISKDTIRTHFRETIESDRTLIKSLKDYIGRFPKEHNLSETCEISE
jgi:PAS domain S-box-containing protein